MNDNEMICSCILFQQLEQNSIDEDDAKFTCNCPPEFSRSNKYISMQNNFLDKMYRKKILEEENGERKSRDV